jgi:hypothetical protein
MTDYTEDQAKADADVLVARLEADPTFAEELKADPRAALVEAGIPEATVNELVGVLSAGSDEPEVEGFNMTIQPTADAITSVCAHQSLQFQGFVGGVMTTVCKLQ